MMTFICGQIFELLLHYTHHADHNVVTASLETLQQLLRRPPPALLPLLTTRGSISRTSIFPHDQKDLLRPRAPSRCSLYTSFKVLESTGRIEIHQCFFKAFEILRKQHNFSSDAEKSFVGQII